MFSPYRRVLATPGALLFSATGLVGRLPISMAGLGIVLLVQAGTGSYAVAGAVSATYMVANAVCAILQGRYVDGWGQGRVLGTLAVAFGAAVTLLVVAVQADWPQPVVYVAAALAGATLPGVGNCVRARWTYVLRGGPQLQTAFALEAVVDEMVFMLGPILVTVLATTIDPVLGLATAAAAGTLGSLAFAAQRRTEPPARPHRRSEGVRPRLPYRTVLPLAVVCAALGVLFGAAEVTTVAFADEQGHKGWSGGLLAVWALGSLVAGVVTGALTFRRSTATRVKIGALGMALAMVPLSFIGSIPVMGVFLLIGGLAIAPTMVAAMSLTQEEVPPSRLTEGMAIMQTGVVAGVAPGAALSGVVVDASGASAAYLVSLAAGVVAALAALAIPQRSPSRPLESPGEHVDQLVATGDGAPDA
ncbi:MFS transporter [Nocardioides anomalus]|uniref:MFS transporter n=1 Tax=Nocardioides anomalus TaxID=2712223 RepID=A0A6G6WC10_9ACTN|nr:MFS transporter [Nocardioides anomalus]QIG42868.1 MFS transporter [Nocardioides anomalus]